MGCWGITALESDDGLDAVGCVRYNLPADGQLDLGEMLERLKKDRWNAPCDVKLGCAHTSPMALAEIIVKYLDGDPGSLDYAEYQAGRHIPMTMQDWSQRLNRFLEFNEHEILHDTGRVTHEIAKAFAESEFEKYRIVQDRMFESDFDHFLALEEQAERKND